MIPLQLLGNALLLWLAYYWLGIGEASTGDLLWSLLVALAIAGGACWLHGATFAYFGESGREFRPASAKALRHLAPLLVAAAALSVVYWLVGWFGEWSSQPAFRIASFLTMKLRIPVRPATVGVWFQGALWLVRWMVLPVLALPMIGGIAERGWSGWRYFGSRSRNWLYWIATPLLAFAALGIPLKLYGWLPATQNFGMEMTSFVLRIAAGYLLFVGAWLLLVYFTSRFTQAN